MVWIQDDELRGLFKVESREHIQALEKGLLQLEADPADRHALEDAFREAHSLKGSARMVGVKDVELISHRIEDILGLVRKGVVSISSVVTEKVYRALDAIKMLVESAVTGESSAVDTAAVLAILDIDALQTKKDNVDAMTRGSTGTAATGEVAFATGASAPAGAAGERADARSEHAYRLDTVRVDTSRLDDLFTLTGELSVFRTRLQNRLKGMDETIESVANIVKISSKYGMASGDAPRRQVSDCLKGLSLDLFRLREGVYEDSSRFDLLAAGLEEGIKQLRLLPFSALFNIFPRAVHDMAREAGKEVRLVIEGAETGVDKRVIEEMKDPLMHMLRNAVVHGIEEPAIREAGGKPRQGTVTLRAMRTESNVIIEVADDGGGLDIDAIKKAAVKRKLYTGEAIEAMGEEAVRYMVFDAGFSTSAFVTETSGRGVGLDVVKANVERLKGAVEVESRPGRGCVFRVRLTATLAAAKMLIVESLGRRYALPMDKVNVSVRLRPADVFLMEGRQAINHNGACISVVDLSSLLELGPGQRAASRAVMKDGVMPCVVISSGAERLGLLVDELVDEQEVVLKKSGAMLKRVRNVAGAAILAGGEVCMILNPSDMIKTVHKKQAKTAVEAGAGVKAKERKKSVLLVEDSITTRTQEKRILEGGGYEVVVAVDGLDAMSKIAARHFDAVVSDIMMPNMDGLTLTERIRRDVRHKDIPVVLVTTLSSDEDKKKGLEAGANAYIPKPAFDQKIFLDTLERLV